MEPKEQVIWTTHSGVMASFSERANWKSSRILQFRSQCCRNCRFSFSYLEICPREPILSFFGERVTFMKWNPCASSSLLTQNIMYMTVRSCYSFAFILTLSKRKKYDNYKVFSQVSTIANMNLFSLLRNRNDIFHFYFVSDYEIEMFTKKNFWSALSNLRYNYLYNYHLFFTGFQYHS